MVFKDRRVWKYHLGHSPFYSLENCGLEGGPNLSEAAQLVRAEQNRTRLSPKPSPQQIAKMAFSVNLTHSVHSY